MKIPKTPPPLSELAKDPNRMLEVLMSQAGSGDERYLHWDKLRFLHPPEGLTREEWWWALKLGRNVRRRDVGLLDCKGRPFGFVEPERIAKFLHKIDRDASGSLLFGEDVVTGDSRDRYIVSSLIDESITSSQLEGASTTRAVAKEMLRTGRKPIDKSERMIVNNYQALQFVRGLRATEMSPELVLEIHRITEDEIAPEEKRGRFRTDEDLVRVETNDGRLILHIPPRADELSVRMERMCDFANGKTPDFFVHPVIRAIILHFWLAYDHPFCDGNGRTARALFYWCMLSNDYWLTEYMSISREIKKAPVKYGKAFLLTETDDNDLTHFLLYHLDLLRRSISAIKGYLEEKAGEQRRVQRLLDATERMNHRQVALIGRALKAPRTAFTIKSHQNSHKVVYETARSDLLHLVDKGLLNKRSVGRKLVFDAVDDLERALSNLKGMDSDRE